MLTQARLKEILDYDSQTGIFVWKKYGNRTKHGKIAGTKHGDGYIRIGIDYKLYLAHRLAWLFVYGYMPVELTDHINGIRNDNKISNLRECSSSQNSQNRQRRNDNKSGFKGISWHKPAKKWQVFIKLNGQSKYLGTFQDLSSAIEARKNAAIKLHGEFANLSDAAITTPNKQGD